MRFTFPISHSHFTFYSFQYKYQSACFGPPQGILVYPDLDKKKNKISQD